MVIHIGLRPLGLSLGKDLTFAVNELDLRFNAHTTFSVQDLDGQLGALLRQWKLWQIQVCVVHSVDIACMTGPDHGEMAVRLLVRNRKDGVPGVALLGLGGLAGKPGAVQFGRLSRPSEVPALIPYLDPSVIAAPVGPQRYASQACRDAYCAAGINK